MEILTEIVPGDTLHRVVINARKVAKYSDFGPIEGYISEMVQGRRYVSINLRMAFDWYHNRWHWMTLNGVIALILRYFIEYASSKFCTGSRFTNSRFSAQYLSNYRLFWSSPPLRVRMYNVIVKVHVRYLTSWWVSCLFLQATPLFYGVTIWDLPPWANG